MGSTAMPHRHIAPAAPDHPIVEPLYRCACCEGVIENIAGDSIPSGLDLRLSLVSDECALVCNECTARLVEANRLNASPANRRR
jgi:hypothetical protein